jgi:glycosyltransferase involved in cell wall biosynthesis
MKIGIVIDTYIKSGGGSNFVDQEISVIESVSKLDDIKKIPFYYICTSQDTYNFYNSKYNNVLFFNKNKLFNLLSFKVSTISFLRKFIYKYKLNFFYNFIKKYELSLLIFLSPSKLVFFCTYIDFVSTVWEMQYKNYPTLPEYKNIYFDIQDRDQICNFISLYAYKIFVGTNKSKDDFHFFYKCAKNKLISKYTNSSIIKSFNINSSDGIKNLNFDFLFYPAQFWSHKNHLYIVKSFQKIKENKLNIKCIFSGSDKGSLGSVKNLIKEYGLDDYFIFLKYLNNNEIAHLYKNSLAVIIPNNIGTYTFPHIEAFFFEKIIFGFDENLDLEFKNRIIKLSETNYDDLYYKLTELKKNDDNIKIRIKENKKFYDDKFKDINSILIYKNLINDYNK